MDPKAEPGRAITFPQRALLSQGRLPHPLLPSRGGLWEVGPVSNQEGMGGTASACLPPPRPHVDPTLLLTLQHPGNHTILSTFQSSRSIWGLGFFINIVCWVTFLLIKKNTHNSIGFYRDGGISL